MTMKNVTDFFASIEGNGALQYRTQVATDVDEIVDVAKEYNYQFNSPELQTFLGKTPKRDLASRINPGIGTRIHMTRR
jgi:hypothetical protein